MFTIEILKAWLIKNQIKITDRGFYKAEKDEAVIDLGGPFLRAHISKSGLCIMLRFQANDYPIGKYELANPNCFNALLADLEREKKYAKLTIVDFEKYKTYAYK